MNKNRKSVDRDEGLDAVVAVGISASKKSKYVISWALETFVPQGCVYFKLLHVRPVISRIPTPMGSYIPISQVREDVATAFKREMEFQLTEKLLPYKNMCSQRKVQLEIVKIESNDIGAAFSGYIQEHKINKLVIGTSSRSMFSRVQTLSSKISECCPGFCSVYAVSKGKLSSMKPSDPEINETFEDDSSETSCSSDNSSSLALSSQAEWTVKGSFSKSRSSTLPEQRFQALSAINHMLLHKRMHPRCSSLNNGGSDVNRATNQALSMARSRTLNASPDQISTLATLPENQDNVNIELEKLRTELRHVRGMYAMTQGEAIDAARKLKELEKRRLDEEINLSEIRFKEEEAKELAAREKRRYEDAKKEAEFVKECAEREAADRKEAEARASREAHEKQKLESALNGNFNRYRPFTWEEITTATSSLSNGLKIGMGAYGTVYKCSFQHTTAAVKVLHVKEASRNNQFHQELEILSRIRHPHLLILLGACPERSCLVYEFMENGSLEDRLFRKNGTPPLPWFDRFRIAHEVASALIFLHGAKPKPVVHRDLKPANILLDRNLVSKIGDVGLSTMVSRDLPALPETCSEGLAGTLCYIDPEYQRTGIVSPESDVYAFGMVVLQLLTGRRAMAVAHTVESAVEGGRLAEVLDRGGGEWPTEEARELAVVGLKCTELRRRDRPGLKEEVLPALERLSEFAELNRNSGPFTRSPPPKHFLCPIMKVVMEDPCVGGDGYTYERRAIETWLQHKDTSPVTGLPLPSEYLTPNYTLLSAIMEWKSARHP